MHRVRLSALTPRLSFLLAAAIFTSPTLANPELLITGFTSDSVARFDLSTRTHLGNLDPAASLDGPLATRLGPDGLLYVADEATNSIKRFNAKTFAYIDTFVDPGDGGLNGPTGITWDANGDLIVPSFNSDNILKYNGQTGDFMKVLVTANAGGLNGPDNGTIVGPDGDLYVPSYFSNRVLKFDIETGAHDATFSAVVPRPRVIEFRGASFYITSESTDAVREHNATTGTFIKNFVTSGSNGLDVPIGMVFGPDGMLYVSSGSNDKIFRYSSLTGLPIDIYLQAGAGGIDAPTFLTIIPTPATALLPLMTLLAYRRARR